MPEEKLEKLYQVVDVPTQTTIAIKTPDGEVVDLYTAVAELLNKVDKGFKALGV